MTGEASARMLRAVPDGAMAVSDVDGQAEAAVTQPRPSKAKKTVPKWESAARDRVRTAIRRVAKPLADITARDANEGDTRLLVTDLLCDGLGFDKYEDLTTEYQVKGEFADYGIRIDKQLVAFIEVKRCTQKLGARHLRQVQTYAVNEGVEWMLLTNGRAWQVWHLTGGLPVQVDLAMEIDLLSDELSLGIKADRMFYLTKEAMQRHLLDDFWKAKAATSPRAITAALTADVVLDSIRKELRRRTSYNCDVSEIRRVLEEEIFRVDLSARP